MRAQPLIAQGVPLEERIVDEPLPESGQILLRALACAVCRTDCLYGYMSDIPSFPYELPWGEWTLVRSRT